MSAKVKIGVLIVSNENKLLLIKEKIKKNPEPRWNIIKGSYGDNGDETIFEAAKRECNEEISIEAELVKSLGCYIAKKDEDIRVQFNFLANIISGEPKIPEKEQQDSLDENITEFKWFTKDELRELSKDEFISNRIYEMVHDWIKDEVFPLESYKQVKM